MERNYQGGITMENKSIEQRLNELERKVEGILNGDLSTTVTLNGNDIAYLVVSEIDRLSNVHHHQ